MVELQPAHYTQGACHTAQGDRQVLNSLVCSEGVADTTGGGLVVSAGVGMGVSVAAGGAFIEGVTTSSQGMYHVYNDAPVPLTIGTSNPSDDRIDLIIARVYDAQFAGALDEWHLEVLAGVASPVPSVPVIPGTWNAIPLASVLVPAGSGSVAAGNITDLRTPYSLCSDSAPQSGLRDVVVYNASGLFQKADYPYAKLVRVKVQGGGGAGGGAAATGSTAASVGGGGGAGGYIESLIDAADLPASVVVTVGAAGALAIGANGGAGGLSRFTGFLTGLGGTGGTRAPANTGYAVATKGLGGDSTLDGPGTLIQQISGQDGTVARILDGVSVSGGIGGNAVSGFGGTDVAVGGTGSSGPSAGVNTGAGGGGAINHGSQAARAGGNGGSGKVIVEIYG